MNRTAFALLGATMASFALTACGGGDAQAAPLPSTPKGLDTVQLNIPDDNPMTAEKAHLGKMLFFDKRLSSDGSMACQSCHLHENGWTDGKRFSQKVGGAMNTRNSPTLYYTGYQPYYYWDGRAPTMEKNVAAAWKGHMGGKPDEMAKTLAAIPAYKDWFQKAFQSEPTGDNIVKALTTFVRTLNQTDSDYDNNKLSAAAKRGQATFQARCAYCHIPPLFTDHKFHNIGAGEKPDVGRGKHEPDNKLAQGAFKTPSLRNVAKTGPYFHDGSYATLREAVAFMVKGGKDNESIDPYLKGIAAMAQADPDIEKTIDDLVAFVEALSSKETFTAPTLPE